MNNVKKNDLTQGPLFSGIFKYAFPMLLTGILQLLYNAADIVVVGNFSKEATSSLAAVGSTGSLTNLVLNLILGLSAGTLVVVAQAYGAKKTEDVEKAVHTSIAVSIVGGIIFGIIGFVGAKTFLQLMDSPDDVIDKATLYMKICFCGVPANVIYNFGSSIIRAAGDTKRPLIILSLSGIVNIVLNLVFVIAFGLDVAGVALATIISQYLSAVAIIIMLMKSNDCIRFYPKRMRIDKKSLISIIRFGLPTGIQGSMFSISNVLVQSSVNLFSTAQIAGNTVGSNIEGFVYTSMNSFAQATLTFTGQNYGANKNDRIKKTLWYSVIQVTVIGLVFGYTALFFGKLLAGIYNPDPQVIDAAYTRMSIILSTYFLCGLMDVFGSQLRGLGYSFTAMLSSVFGACIFRSVWILTIFKIHQTPTSLYITYPLSWIITLLLNAVILVFAYKKLNKCSQEPKLENSENAI